MQFSVPLVGCLLIFTLSCLHVELKHVLFPNFHRFILEPREYFTYLLDLID